jgi:hypothetical protein
VPKPTLLTAIKAKTKDNFVRSDQVGAGKELTVTAEAGKTVPGVFKATTTPDKVGYIDYVL